MPFWVILFLFPLLNGYFLSNDVVSDLNEVTCYVFGVKFCDHSTWDPSQLLHFPTDSWSLLNDIYS